MGDLAIRVHHISKRYTIGEVREKTLRAQLSANMHQMLARQSPARTQETADRNTIWALQDISFDLEQGQVLGVIGANGSGKSTLLRILCGVTHPTTGWVGVNGRIGSLLGVGTGFNADLTGRENIYLNGAILGLKRAEITRKFDEIVAFSEIDQFLDTQVKYYSSGMHVRLAFSVAVHLNADILLIDEVLAVGDAAFRQKSMARMEKLVHGEGRTIILVSHDNASIASFSTKCIYLRKGAMVAEGDPATVLGKYADDSTQKIEQNKEEYIARSGDGPVHIRRVQFLDAQTRLPTTTIRSGQDVVVAVDYESDAGLRDSAIDHFHIELAFFNRADQFVTAADSRVASNSFKNLPPVGTVYCHIPRIPLMEGTFRLASYLLINGKTSDYVSTIGTILVEAADYYQSGNQILGGRQGVYMNQTWSDTLDPQA